MPIKTTCIGAYPKPNYLPIRDWFDVGIGTDAFNNSIKDKVQQIHELGIKVERFEGETLDFYLSIADVGELK